MRLELKLCRWAKRRGEHLHEPLPVAPRVQAVHGVLDDVQTLVARRLQVVLGRQVSPEGAVQAGVVSQVAALMGERRPGFKVAVIVCEKKKTKPRNFNNHEVEMSCRSQTTHTHELAADQTCYSYSPNMK